MRISDWSADVCSSDLILQRVVRLPQQADATALARHRAEMPAVIEILLPAVLMDDITGDAQQQRVIEQRHIDGALALGQAVVAAAPRRVTAELILGFGRGVEIGRPSGRERECPYVEI